MDLTFLDKFEHKDRKILIGITLVLFGVLFLLKELNVISSNNILLDFKMFPIYLAAIFLYGKETKIASIFGIIALILWIPELAGFIGDFAHLLWPLLLIGLGVLLIVSVKKKKEAESEEKRTNAASNPSSITDNATIVDVEEIDDIKDDEKA
ncbi:MAG: hypothetical protein IJJ77_07240 [Paludibacteraceae bacterium]|nr:hypothetical protein [Paludibacteraceae bacterium]